MFNRFSKEAKAAVTSAVEEAQRRDDRRVGTEHLLLGLLRNPASDAATALGVDLEQARAGLDQLDRKALACVGVDTPGFEPVVAVHRRGHVPFTGAAKAALVRTLTEATHRGDRRLEPRHLLLALLGPDQPDAAVELLARLDVDPVAVRARLERAA